MMVMKLLFHDKPTVTHTPFTDSCLDLNKVPSSDIL